MIASRYNIVFPLNDRKFIFNLASQALIEVNDQLLDELSLIETNNTFSEEEIENLTKNGIIVSSSAIELAHLKDNVNNLKYDKKRFGIFISMTAGCNLNCSYCYQDDRKKLNSNTYFTLEKWNVLLNNIKKRIINDNVDYVAVSFFGGEPMMDDLMLRRIINDLKALETKKTHIAMLIITNGTLFTPDNVDFYISNLDSIQITVDGMKNIHDTYRVFNDGSGSFDLIMQNLQMLIQRGVSELTLRINVTESSADQAYDFIDYLSKIGLSSKISALSINEIFEPQSIIKEIGGEKRNTRTVLAKKIADLYLYAAKKGISMYKGLGGPCIANMSYSFAVDENLNLYSCPGYVYSTSHGQLTEEGQNITDITWYDNVQNDSKCLNSCKYAPICYGGCSWAKGEQEVSCGKDIYDITIIPKLQAYVLSHY